MTTEEINLASELADVVELLHEAQRRLLDLANGLIEPDMSGCECKRDSAQPSQERRSHEKRQENP